MDYLLVTLTTLVSMNQSYLKALFVTIELPNCSHKMNVEVSREVCIKDGEKNRNLEFGSDQAVLKA